MSPFAAGLIVGAALAALATYIVVACLLMHLARRRPPVEIGR